MQIYWTFTGNHIQASRIQINMVQYQYRNSMLSLFHYPNKAHKQSSAFALFLKSHVYHMCPDTNQLLLTGLSYMIN